MSWIKRHWKWFAILAVLIAGGAFLFTRGGEEEVEVVTDRATRERLVQSVDATGDLASLDEANLSFDISGTIETIFVDVGDVVVRDQLLAVLNTTELRANLENTRQSLRAAEANLSQKNAGSTAQAIEVARASVTVAEASVAAAEVDLENANDDLEQTIAVNAAAVIQAELAVSAAEDALENVLASAGQNDEELREDLVSALKSSMIAVRSALSDADEVLGVDNTLGNNDFEDVLSSLDFQALQSATFSYKQATAGRDRAEDVVFVLAGTSSDTEIDYATGLVEDALLLTEATLLDTRRVLDATAVDTADFTFEELSALKVSIDAARGSIQAESSSLQSALQLMSAKEVANSSSEIDAENNLASATQSLESAKAQQSSQISLAEASVRRAEVTVQVREADLVQAKARLAEVEAGPRYVDVAALEAQVRAVQADLEAAEARLARAEIRSTLDGVVTEISLEEGEQVFDGTTVVVVHSSQDAFEILVNVPEADIAKVELRDRAELTFDAFGDDRVFNARVTKIDPAEKQIEGVVFYEVAMLLEEDVISDMKPGMSVDVTIVTEELEDALTVPQRAVLRKNGSNYVRIPVQGAEFEERTVEVGVRGDGGRVQILSGLSEGEQVITSIRTP